MRDNAPEDEKDRYFKAFNESLAPLSLVEQWDKIEPEPKRQRIHEKQEIKQVDNETKEQFNFNMTMITQE